MARGSIRKLDGAWGPRIDLGPDPATRKRRQVSKQGFVTKRDAEAALRELSQSVDKGMLAKRSMRTLGDYLDEWHELQEDRLRATTWHSYAIAIDRTKRRLGQARLQALEPLELERFYAYLLVEGGRFGKCLSPKTVRNTHTVLRKALSDAERPGLVGRNAAASAQAPSDDRTEYQMWSSDELRTFRDVARDHRLYAAFVLLMTTGMRGGEVLGLRHSYATLALKAGIHPKFVSEQLGHATVGITLELYSHVTPSIARDTANVVVSRILDVPIAGSELGQ